MINDFFLNYLDMQNNYKKLAIFSIKIYVKQFVLQILSLMLIKNRILNIFEYTENYKN